MDKPLDISWVQYFPNVFFFVFVFSSMWLIMPKYLLTAALNLLSEGYMGQMALCVIIYFVFMFTLHVNFDIIKYELIYQFIGLHFHNLLWVFHGR